MLKLEKKYYSAGNTCIQSIKSKCLKTTLQIMNMTTSSSTGVYERHVFKLFSGMYLCTCACTCTHT